MIAREAQAAVPSGAMADEMRRAFGMAVQIERRRRKRSQQSLADAAQITRAYLSKIETGASDPTMDVQHRIAVGLGMTLPRLWERAAQELKEQRAVHTEEARAEDK